MSDLGQCISACREKIAMGQRVGRCYVCVEELRQDFNVEVASLRAVIDILRAEYEAAERGLAEWQAKSKADAPALDAIRELQNVPSPDFWKVYDDLRDICTLAQGVSKFVDRIANKIPDAAGTPEPRP